eukprot:1143245-Pelagomonas_calceolata.AAC.3
MHVYPHSWLLQGVDCVRADCWVFPDCMLLGQTRQTPDMGRVLGTTVRPIPGMVSPSTAFQSWARPTKQLPKFWEPRFP